jgi:hypothetical protein
MSRLSLYGAEWMEAIGYGLCPEAEAVLPPFGPIEGHNWFFQISSQ